MRWAGLQLVTVTRQSQAANEELHFWLWGELVRGEPSEQRTLHTHAHTGARRLRPAVSSPDTAPAFVWLQLQLQDQFLLTDHMLTWQLP